MSPILEEPDFPFTPENKTVFEGVISEDTLNLVLLSLKNGDFQQRWELAKIFPKLDKDALIPLLAIWEDKTEDRELRWFVGRILGNFSEAEVVLSLVKILQQSEEEELLTVATESLSKIGQEAVACLTQLLTEDEEKRLLAIKALAQIRSQETISPLLSMVNDPNSDIRGLAIEALGSFHNSTITQVLLDSLQDKAAKVRTEGIIALGFRHPTELTTEIVAQITPFLSDFNPEVCQQTALTLGRIATPQSMEALFAVLKSPMTPVWLQLPIVRALGWCETEQAIAYLGQTFEWADSQICEEIVSILGKQVKNELKQQASDLLINYLYLQKKDLQKIQIRQKIAIAIGNLGQKNAQKALELLAKDAEKTVRLHANFALKQLMINN